MILWPSAKSEWKYEHVYQKAAACFSTRCGRAVQRGEAVRVRGVEVGAAVPEDRADRGVAVLRRAVEGRPAGLVNRPDLADSTI